MSYGPQRTAAEHAVAGLTGVRNIRDEVVVSWGADPVDVTALVQDALDRRPAAARSPVAAGRPCSPDRLLRLPLLARPPVYEAEPGVSHPLGRKRPALGGE